MEACSGTLVGKDSDVRGNVNSEIVSPFPGARIHPINIIMNTTELTSRNNCFLFIFLAFPLDRNFCNPLIKLTLSIYLILLNYKMDLVITIDDEVSDSRVNYK